MKKKILVVDNNDIMLEFMKDTLSNNGYQVKTSKDGISALEVLKTYTPDIIFVDLVMPNISGEKLCRVVRDMPELSDAYLIVLSAIAAEQEVDFTEFGADACIAKCPFDKMSKLVLDVLDELPLSDVSEFKQTTIGQTDIHQREITKELLSSQKHFEAILGNMSEGILELTSDAKIVYANSAAISLSGIQEEKLLATGFMKLFNNTDGKKIAHLFESLNGVPLAIPEDSPVVLNGKQVSLSILPVKDDEVCSAIVIINDISERKRIESKLRQVQKMEAIGTLAGGVAHDFNNLLMGIQGNASLMLLKADPGHIHHERLKNIEQYVQNGAHLTKQLLSFASGGKFEVKPTNLNELIQKSVDMFGRTKKEITIYPKYQEDIWTVEIDRGQIEQVLLNLYINAWQAMPGGGEIYIKTENVFLAEDFVKPYDVRQGNYVKVSVTDTGVGMDDRTAERIFDPFFTTKELGRGTGLGLASAYGIVKNHGGIINVLSEKGNGATFNIYLPISEKDIAENISHREQSLQGSETILLVDDEEMIIDVGSNMLKSLGYKVLTASGGKEAVDMVEKLQKSNEAPDLVILDMVMPKLGGLDTYELLRSIKPDIKVLLSSGYGINGQIKEILKRGCKGFIQKPFNMIELSKTIRRIFDKNDHISS